MSDGTPDTTDRTEPPTTRAATLERHPVITVAVATGLIAVGHAVWIWNHRRLGGLDPDESGYLATAFQYHRSFDLLHPYDFVHAVGATGFAPLVPLLSVPLLWLGPDDPRTAMMLMPLLMVVCSVLVAATVLRVARPSAAIAAGIAFSILPTVTAAAQTYWFGLGAATGFAGAMFALLASDRCRTRTTWWFGVGVAAMLLSRTMALGFVPAAVAAAAVVTRWDRRSLTRLAQSGLVCLAIAGPWWFVERSTIFGYLGDYGYGDRAGLFGDGNAATRLWFRVHRLGEAIGTPLAIALVLVGLLAAVASIIRRRSTADTTTIGSGRAPLSDRGRAVLALGAALACGLAALVSTSNNGVWFELPLVTAAVALAAIVIDTAPITLRLVAIAPAVGMMVIQTPVSWWWLPLSTTGVPWLAENHLYATQYEPAFAEYDPRWTPERRVEADALAAEWWSLTDAVAERLQGLAAVAPIPLSVWVSGNMELFNTNTLYLHEQLAGRTVPFHIPDTTLSASRRRADLTPTLTDDEGTTRRVLVVARHDHVVFTPDRDVAAFRRQAVSLGWAVSDTFPMPGGGEVEILLHGDR